MNKFCKVICEDTQEIVFTYEDYMKTKHWKLTRDKFKKSNKTNGRCYVCNSKYEIHYHHLTYDRIGKERLTDLIELCSYCHRKVHNRISREISEVKNSMFIVDLLKEERNKDFYYKKFNSPKPISIKNRFKCSGKRYESNRSDMLKYLEIFGITYNITDIPKNEILLSKVLSINEKCKIYEDETISDYIGRLMNNHYNQRREKELQRLSDLEKTRMTRQNNR